MKYINSLCVSLVLIIVGCVTVGGKFTVLESPKNGAARLYVFRPSCPPYYFNPTIYINDIKVSELVNQSYCDINLMPGKYKVESHWSVFSGVVGRKKYIDIEAKSGTDYYIIVTTRTDTFITGTIPVMPVFIANNNMAIIDANRAIPILKECDRVEKYSDVDKMIIPQ